jgi:hypothetical protein
MDTVGLMVQPMVVDFGDMVLVEFEFPFGPTLVQQVYVEFVVI